MLAKNIQPCPCCGHDMPASDVLVDLTNNVVAYRNRRIFVQAKHAEFIEILARRSPAPAAYEYIISNLWGINEPESPKDSLTVYACRTRKPLAFLGLRIKAVWKRGYRLEKIE